MMPKRRRAQSVLEYLTSRNPTITPVNNAKTKNTEHPSYLKPVELRPWKEFKYTTLETIFGGELLKEAQKRQSRDVLPHYPHIDQSVTTLGKSHPSTVDVLNKWNNPIVVAALRAVEDFHPCIWVSNFGIDLSRQGASSTEIKTGLDKGKSKTRGMKRTNRGKKSMNSTHEQKPKRERVKQPDGGAVSLEEEDRRRRLGVFEELFPKEIKTLFNWNSQKLRDGLYTDEETGKWIGAAGEKNDNAPIRQAYTYCVNYRCRYGCILTTEEAFIFRIKPRRKLPASSKDDLALVEKVKVDGLMEFVSVPWENGCDSNHHEYRRLTVNLALWFTHILAGNNHRLDWDWGLCEESVFERARQKESIRGHKRRQSHSQVPTMRKRNHREKTREQAQNQEVPDPPNWSFSGNPIPLPNMSLGRYAESSNNDNDSTVDGDLESPPLKRRGIC